MKEVEHSVIIVGGGAGGAELAAALGRQSQKLEMKVSLVDCASQHLWKPRLHEVAAGVLGDSQDAIPYLALGHANQVGGLMPVDKLAVTLIDMAPCVLAGSAPAVSSFASSALQKLGVRLRLNDAVARVIPTGFVLKSGEIVLCDLRVWASGVIGRPLAAKLNLPLDRSRRIVCDAWLRCTGVDDVYAMGDCAAVVDPHTDRPLPTTAQVAHQQAAYLCRRLTQHPSQSSMKAFRYRDRGSLVSLGAQSTAGEFPIARLRVWTFNGILPKFAYLSLHLMHRATLIGWRRAVTLMLADGLQRTVAPSIKLH